MCSILAYWILKLTQASCVKGAGAFPPDAPPRSGLVWRICQRQSDSGARAPVDCRRQRRGPAAVQRRKTHALAVNGEIYNHQALRAEYGDRYQFQTGSDCEVILALYQEKGPEFLDDLQECSPSPCTTAKKTRT